MSTAVQCVCGGEFSSGSDGRLACTQCGAGLTSLAAVDETQTIEPVAVEVKPSAVDHPKQPGQTDPLMSELVESLAKPKKRRSRSSNQSKTSRRRRSTKRAAVAALNASVSEDEVHDFEPEALSEFDQFLKTAMSETLIQNGPLGAGAIRRLFEQMFDANASASAWEDASRYAARTADHELMRLLVVVEIDEVSSALRVRCVGRFIEKHPLQFLSLPDAYELWTLVGGLARINKHRPKALERLRAGLRVRNKSGQAVLAEIGQVPLIWAATADVAGDMNSVRDSNSGG